MGGNGNEGDAVSASFDKSVLALQEGLHKLLQRPGGRRKLKVETIHRGAIFALRELSGPTLSI